MDRIKAPKTENVICWRAGKSIRGALHLDQYHMIFRYPKPGAAEPEEYRESWIAYPMIGFCTYRPSPPASHQPPSIRIRCRDFNFMAFHFEDDPQARAVFENIRLLTCRLGSIDKLYAFNYTSNMAERDINGWAVYNPKREFERMGISGNETTCAWRFSSINSKYKYCDTYPALLCVPKVISDTTLKHTANFRSKCRIPVLTYIYALNNCTITRAAQPNVGVRLSRSPQDEKLVGAIFNSTKPTSIKLRSAPATPRNGRSSSDLTNVEDTIDDIDSLNISSQTVEDSAENISSTQSSGDMADLANGRIYGAQQTNMIIDARPSVNAMANHAKGYGSERMDGYKGAQKQFLGIDNIHVMRNSLDQVIDALKDSDLTSFPPNRMTLEKSKWRKHIDLLLQGTRLIAHTIAIQHSHVLIHCSDGWDRTSQLSSLAQLCLDPFYRTMEGFIILIEKDWLSFGYMFRLRSGLLSHEKWFETENDRSAAFRNGEDGAVESEAVGNPFESAISRAQLFFRRRNEMADEDSSDAEALPVDASPATHNTKLSETSPIFHQFLDATYQLLRQNPTRFEFNERFLRRLLYHLYSCQYGTFLYNCEKERVDSKASERTKSVWSYFLSRRSQFVNENYDAEIDEMVKEKASLLEVNPQDVRWWHELFGRTELEMNGPTVPPPPTLENVVDGTQSATDSVSSSLEQSSEGAVFGTVSNINYMSGVGKAAAATNTGTSTTSTASGTNINLRFARMEESPRRRPDVEDVTLANAESAASRTETLMTPERDSRWVSGLRGKTKQDPLDVEMQ